MVLSPLPYALDALEPYLSRRTLSAHHGRHHAAYIEKARALVVGTPLASCSLEEIVLQAAGLADRTLFHAASQAWNHDFYWRSMKPGGGGEPHGQVAPMIEIAFGSYRKFCEEFTGLAVDQFGSGWAWLSFDGDQLRSTATANAETPLTCGAVPLLVVDVWEHAYYLDYEHRRPGYVAAFLEHLVNWDFANARLRLALGDQRLPPARRRAAGQKTGVT